MKLTPSEATLIELIEAAGGKVCSVDGCARPVRSRGLCNAHHLRRRRHGDPLKGGTERGAPERWIREVALSHNSDECLQWPFGRDRHGYGDIAAMGKKHTGAHRYVCSLVNGPPPSEAHEAAHSCGGGRNGCVNPHHLSWKTPAQNQADRVAHGTSNRGERHGHAKLTREDVLEIRSELSGGRTSHELARRFGVQPRTVRQIRSRDRWAWL